MRKTQLFVSAIAVILGVCFIATRATSQEQPAGQPMEQPAAAEKAPAGEMDEAMMKAFMEAGAIGPQHKALEPMAGDFTFVNKYKMDPAQEWQTCQGTYEGQMIMGGRYLVSDVKGDMMGMQFHGMGCLGYDNTLKKYVNAWIDSMGTGIMRSEGTASADGKTITFAGDMMCPVEHTMKQYKYQYEIKSDDEFVMRWWSPSMSDGQMFESMVITYTRVK